ncbi:unnamed protein product [Effrenium voratum]|uniref:Transmembrane protein n=1 Tax=Effrenium voratum TaxID=2562239 RepID=A0AA36NLV3_9DINO|nr:unnamed protein product [Effrenium voratum]CAJ1434698.1 unnamed protein product [Effrenium voratum]
MASRADQCMSTCIMPFFLLALIAALFDVFNVIQILSAPYPGAGNMFSQDCPKPVPAILRKNTTIYLKDAAVNGTAAYVVPQNTQVDLPRNICSAAWVVGNVALLLGTLLDIVAARVGYKMFKISMELMQDPSQGGLGQLMMTQQGGAGPGDEGGPGPRPQRQQPARQQGFQPFQGSGQTLTA